MFYTEESKWSPLSIYPGNGWFLESIIVKYEEEDGEQEVLFPCNRYVIT